MTLSPSKTLPHLAALASVLILASCGEQEEKAEAPAPEPLRIAAVDTDRIVKADDEPGNWMSYGRTYSEQRFSPLTQINDGNVQDLGLAWHFDLDTNRGQEATPLVVDGIMYVSTAWSMVKALDAKTGELIWSYDPQVPREKLVEICCGPVNRGVALWQGMVYVGTLDGRLIALDAESGEEVWSAQTVDPEKPYSITGAPRVANGKVYIGNSGGEFGVRGYLSAYDAESGDLVWRFYTVPGNPADGFESPIMEEAAKTWTGEWWTEGGGGPTWNGLTYDPELNRIYFGVGNGVPWTLNDRSPEDGNNLFLVSIVAVDADTGEYVWHYQQVPGDAWDFDANADLIMADLEIEGETRKVLMQAPKNGFFYVLDRETGELISAEPFVNVNWASGIDLETGLPNIVPEAKYWETGVPFIGNPGPSGAHSWHPTAFNPQTGLVYLPANDMSFPFILDEDYEPGPIGFNTGLDFGAAAMPPDPAIQKQALAGAKGSLLAWDPVRQEAAWRVDHKGPWNGGVLTTAGNLVVQGTADGRVAVYAADSGEELWSSEAQTGVIAGPMTYSVDGEQYIAVAAGWGGVFPLAAGVVSLKSGRQVNISRVLAYKLGGTASLPPKPDFPMTLNPPPLTADDATVAKGLALYSKYCSTCHGDAAVSGGVTPDLRYSATLRDEAWTEVVLGGLLKENGMVSFSSVLSEADAEAVRHYVIKRAHDAPAEEAILQ